MWLATMQQKIILSSVILSNHNNRYQSQLMSGMVHTA